jgi:hypothetical protein
VRGGGAGDACVSGGERADRGLGGGLTARARTPSPGQVGFTPLHLAVKEGKDDAVVRALLDAGADVSLETAVRDCGHSAVEELPWCAEPRTRS